MRFEKYYQPQSIEECQGILTEYGSDAKVLAGGTDLVPRLKNHMIHPTAVVGLMDIPGMDETTVTEKGLVLGALANLRDISLNPALDQNFLVVKECCGHVSSQQVRNIATIGGNACNASPSADAVHGLLLNDAVCRISGPSGEREVFMSGFFVGPGKTVLMPDELLKSFFVPAPAEHTGAAYKKYAIRGDSDISIVGAGARLTLREDGAIAEARITLASVAPTPVRMVPAEKILVGEKPCAELFAEAAEICAQNVRPITVQRATREYRVEMVRVWARHALEEACARAEK